MRKHGMPAGEAAKAAARIAGELSLEEAVSLLSGSVPLEQIIADKRAGIHFNSYPYPAGGNAELGIPPVRFADGPRGIVCSEGETTCFPVPVMRAASFDTRLEERIAHAIGREARYFGANLYGGVCVNLPYYPGWGRSQQTFGEDPFLLGRMGAATVRGVQKEGVMACVKHFALNSMENSRFKVDITCSDRAEQEVFLPHFRDCIDAGAAAVMTAYNHYRGKLCGQSERLIRQILKEKWRFSGFVLSDFYWGIDDTVQAMHAGCDLEMSHTLVYGDKLLAAVRNNEVPEQLVREAAERIIRTILRVCGQNTDREDDRELSLPSRAHAALALQSAREGITLLKNDGLVLPFRKGMQRIAVFGALAAKANLGDHGSSSVYPDHTITILEGLVNALPSCDVVFYDGSDPHAMARIAGQADACVCVAGLDYWDEGEYDAMSPSRADRTKRGGDRVSLRLHENEERMLMEVGMANRNTAAVLMGGGALLTSPWEDAVSAVLLAYYPGQEGGTAVADVLFGRTCPGGKLPFVIPEREEDLPAVELDAAHAEYGYDHGYRLLLRKGIRPRYPFGFGLSYTSFAFSDPCFSYDAQAGRHGTVMASVDLINTGTRSGAEVLQLYAGFPCSRVTRSVRTLCGFRRVVLRPGEKKRVTISCPQERLWYYDADADAMVPQDTVCELYIGTSSAGEDLLCGCVRIGKK